MGNVVQELEALSAQVKAVMALMSQSGHEGVRLDEVEVFGLVLILEQIGNRIAELIEEVKAG